jgi:hypothetical protein
MLWVAGLAEAGSEHPLALAVLEAGGEAIAARNGKATVLNVESVAGGGLSCNMEAVLDDATGLKEALLVLVGNERLVKVSAVVAPPPPPSPWGRVSLFSRRFSTHGNKEHVTVTPEMLLWHERHSDLGEARAVKSRWFVDTCAADTLAGHTVVYVAAAG